MEPIFFEKQSDFRKWLVKNHKKEKELLVGFYKVNSGKPSMTWTQSVDEAICFGWIDGVRKSIDKESYQIRFSKRKSKSIWSSVNIEKVGELKKKGLLQPSGLLSFENREEDKSRIYSYEKEEVKFPIEFEKKFKTNRKAWAYFESLAASYRKTSINWVMSAKQETTRHKRLSKLIADSATETNKWKDNKYKKK